MAEGKKSFVLYSDQRSIVDMLPNEIAGRLLKHIFSYVNDESPTSNDPLLLLAFEPIKLQMKRDLKKWEQTKEGRSAAGKASAEARRIAKEGQQNSTNSTNVEFVEQTSTNPTVNDNVTVTVNVNDTVNEKEKKKDSSTLLCSFSSKTELDNDIDRATFSFWELFKSNLVEAGINKTTLLDKATLEKWRVPVKLMLEKDSRTVAEFTEVFKFLKTNSFWKKNIQSTEKLREKFERLLVEARQKPETKKDKNAIEPHHAERIMRNLQGQ